MDEAINSIVARLAKEFDDTFDTDTITEFVTASYKELARDARTPTYLGLLAERFARQRLRALAQTQHVGAVPAVLFLCIHNAGRSQMALGWFNHLAASRAIAWSGGSEPGNEINPAAIEAMHEVGIDITGEFPKPWTSEILQAADVVVTMGCGDQCPWYPGKRYEDWQLEDPAGEGADAVRPIRDDIEQRVRTLLTSLNIDTRTDVPSQVQPRVV